MVLYVAPILVISLIHPIQSLLSGKPYLSSRWQCPGGSTPGHPWPHSRPRGRDLDNSPCGNAGSDQSQCPQSEVHIDLKPTINFALTECKSLCLQRCSLRRSAGAGRGLSPCWGSPWCGHQRGSTPQFWSECWIIYFVKWQTEFTWRRAASCEGFLEYL